MEAGRPLISRQKAGSHRQLLAGCRWPADRLAPPVAAPPPRQCLLYLDTNLLIDFPDLERYRGGFAALTLVVLEAVARELEGLGRGGGETAARARRAALALGPYRRRPEARRGLPLGRSGHVLRLEPGQGVADDLLLASAGEALRRQPEAAVAIVTRDAGLADRARAALVPVVQVHGTFDNAQLQRAVRDALAEARWR